MGAAEAGSRGLEVRIQASGGGADELAADDKRSAVLGVREAPRLLLIGEAAPTGEPPGVFDLLRRFLDLGPGAPVSLTASPPSRAIRELEEAEIAVLADPRRLDPGLRDALVEHVAGGGGLLVAPGPACDPEALEPLAAALGLAGLEIGAPTPVAQPSARLRIADAAHPALLLFRDPRWLPLLTEVPHREFRPLRLPPEQLGAARPLRFVRGAGEDRSQELGDALLTWQQDGARCAILAALPLPEWNGMTSVPGGTLPLLLDLGASLAPRPPPPPPGHKGRPHQVAQPRAPGTPAGSRSAARSRSSCPAPPPRCGCWTRTRPCAGRSRTPSPSAAAACCSRCCRRRWCPGSGPCAPCSSTAMAARSSTWSASRWCRRPPRATWRRSTTSSC